MPNLANDLRNFVPTLPLCQFEFFRLNEFGQVTHADPLAQLLMNKGLNLSGRGAEDPYDIILTEIGKHYGGNDLGLAIDFYLKWDQMPTPLVQSTIFYLLHTLGA